MTQEALKLALEMVQNKMYAHAEMYLQEALAKEKALQALHDENERLGLYKEAYAQPEQDSTCSTTLRLQGKPYPRTCKKCGLGLCIAQPTAQPEQETVADDFFRMIADRNPKPFSSLQRTWVGLTDDEIDAIYTGVRAVHHEINSDLFARAIESKLKEVNT